MLALIALSDPAHTQAVWRQASRYAQGEFATPTGRSKFCSVASVGKRRAT